MEKRQRPKVAVIGLEDPFLFRWPSFLIDAPAIAHSGLSIGLSSLHTYLVIPNQLITLLLLGAFGLTALKNLLEQDFDAIGIERNDYVGGLWKWNPDPTRTTTLHSTRTNLSHQSNSYTDFPFPPGTPDYPTAEQVTAYYQSYATHFNLFPHIRLNTTVHRIYRSHPDPLRPGKTRWIVRLSTSTLRWDDEKAVGGEEREEEFDKIYMATGPFGVPKMPCIEGLERFGGGVRHAQGFKRPEDYANKRVLIVGMGNSAGDVAVSLVGIAKEIWMSHRAGVRIIKRQLFNKPIDHTVSRRRLTTSLGLFSSYFPRFTSIVTDHLLACLMKFTHRNLNPSWKLLPAPPYHSSAVTVNDDLVSLFHSGDITPLTGIRLITETSVITDEGKFEIDAITCCTGYTYDYSLLPPDANPYQPQFQPYPLLYQSIFTISHPDSLAIVGPYFGFSFASTRNADLYAQAVAQVWLGHYPLPPRDTMIKWAEDTHIHHRQLTRGKIGDSTENR